MEVIFAATRGELERVKALVEQDANLVHFVDEDVGWTPLLCAAVPGHVEVARYLLDHGATVNHLDHQRFTALHHASSFNYANFVYLLLQRGADVTEVDGGGWTPLLRAAFWGNDALVRALLEHGESDVNAVDEGGYTACHWASRMGGGGTLRQLLEAGADPTLRNAQGRTALDLAMQGNELECVTTLQEWDRAYLLHRGRGLRDPSSSAPQQGL